MPSSFTLTFACQDRPGIVSRVTAGLVRIGGNIQDANHFNDAFSGRFFCRIAFEVPAGVSPGAVEENVSASLAPWTPRGP